MAFTLVTENCPRCHGKGVVPPAMHRGCAAGICYQCAGARTVTTKEYDEATRAKRAAKREAARIARLAPLEAARAERLEAFAVADPELAMVLDAIPGEIGSYARFSVADGRVSGSWPDVVAFVLESAAQARRHAG